MRRSLILPFLAFGVLLVLPHVVFAATTNFFGPIVTNNVCNCQGLNSAPDYACVLQTLQNGINAAVSFGMVIITVYIALAGVTFMTNPTNPEARSKGRARVINAILGLVIILCAWLLVDTVMKVVYNAGASGADVASLGPWNAILADSNTDDNCLIIHTPPPLTGLSSANSVGSTGSSQTGAALNTAGSGACNATQVESAAAGLGAQISTSDANTLSCLAQYESSCGTINKNYNWGKGSSAYGPFQMTLQGNAQYFNNSACESAVGATGPLNCQNGFSGGNEIPGSTVAATCERAAANLGCSAEAAAQLYDAHGISPWTADPNASKQGACAQ